MIIRRKLIGLFISIIICLLPVRGLCFEKGEVVLLTAENIHTLNVYIADTPEEWQQGLQGMKGLKDDEGMFFIFPREGIQTFTARNVQFPIDIIFIDKEGRIVGIFEEAFGNRNYAIPIHVLTVLEVNGGFCRKNNVTAGHMVRPVGFEVRPKAAARPKHEERKIAEQRLRENLDKFPNDPGVYEELAVFYTLSGETEKALQLFRDLLNLGPTPPRLNGMGVIYERLGNFGQAEKYFKQAIEKDTRFYGAYHNLARIYLRRGRLREARRLFEEAIGLNSDYVEAYLGLFELHLATGDMEAAEALMEKAKDIKSPEMVRMAGNVYLRKGEYEKAADQYAAYLQARPNDENAPELRSFILLHKVRAKQVK